MPRTRGDRQAPGGTEARWVGCRKRRDSVGMPARRYGSARGLPHGGMDGGRARERSERLVEHVASRLAVEKRVIPYGSQRLCKVETDGILPLSTDVGSHGTTVVLLGRRTARDLAARFLTPPRPCRQVGTGDPMSAPAAGGVLGGAPRRACGLPPKPGCRGPGRAGPGPGGGLAQNLHKVGPAAGRHRRGRRLSYRTGTAATWGYRLAPGPPPRWGRLGPAGRRAQAVCMASPRPTKQQTENQHAKIGRKSSSGNGWRVSPSLTSRGEDSGLYNKPNRRKGQ